MRRCPNCEAEAPRHYCPECGQDQERSLRASMATLAPEAVEQAFSLDSRFARTLWNLLFRPGRVTADYLEGRRARYSSPVNFYLFCSFLFFAAASLAPDDGSPTRVKVVAGREEAARALEEAKADASPAERLVLDQVQAQVAGGLAAAPGASADHPGNHGLARAEEWLRARPWVGPLAADRVGALRHLPPEEAGRRIAAAFAQNAPRVLFFLVPVMALVLKLLWPRRWYAEHLVLSLHAQSMTFLLLLPATWLSGWNGPALLLALAWGALALRRVYGCGWGAALGKGAVLGLALLVALGLGLAVAGVAAVLLA